MSAADLTAWLGKTARMTERFDPARSNALGAALGEPGRAAAGDPVPLLHHWLYFWDVQPPQHLGADGHPAKGGFLPPVPLPRRMWAGGEVTFAAPLRFGEEVVRTSTITGIAEKQGRSGALIFVTVEHELTGSAGLALRERQDLVYRAAEGAAPVLPEPCPAPPSCDAHCVIQPDTVLLQRYSALTMNGHRIHYDRPYAREVEGYPALVVHGPLQATLLAMACGRLAGAPLARFSFRGLAPAFDGLPLHICAERVEGGVRAWTQQGSAPGMTADAAV